ncbi:DUF2971 domain-containing protein [Shimia sp. R9_2]|uniref:DUF2971 domain-containing protein n=1 Tax=Shimia sp. R9_2 TaxID=2821112 RepID=UPI001ADCF867|nr:DUF2971 domain-containing protein [Shimia sp. R9_2]MBO9396785.1 DUF2971 domain-containing protein [Shimia sp. R9_2]
MNWDDTPIFGKDIRLMNSEKLLFHYCSTQTGFAILQKREIRLSALSSANDTLEGRVLGRVFTHLLRETELPEELVDVAAVIVEGYPDATEGFAFCLSEKGDLLSQWRSYGRDGSGFALGFSRDLLEEDFGDVNFGSRFFELMAVNYGEKGLNESLKPFVEDLATEFVVCGSFARLRDGINKERALALLANRENQASIFIGSNDKSSEVFSRLLQALSPLHFQIYKTKPLHFHEECEWRLLRYRHKVALPEVEYFADDHSIRPYITSSIADPAREVIKEVVLGPKNRTNLSWMRAFLDSVGLPHVRVLRSSIDSYR